MLEVREIKARLESPKQRARISKASEHEQRLRFHTETSLSHADAGRAASLFLNWVRGLIPFDKYNIFLSLFSYPVKTAELTEQIYQALEKVFDGQDPVHHYDFSSKELADDWDWYRKEIIHDPVVWREKGFKAMQTMINSIVIVDLPSQQTTPRPEPYFYWLPIEEVVDFEISKDGAFEWVIFKQPEGRVAAFDDQFLRVFSTRENNHRDLDEMISETAHPLGYCPAHWFWHDRAMSFDPCLKKSPISNQLGDLDWLLFFETSKQHLDLYAAYPIYSGFMQDCDYSSDEFGQYCNGGFLVDSSDAYIFNRDGRLMECPVCSRKRLAGVGSFIEIPPPGPENNNADLRNPVQITTIDKTSLDYNVAEVDRLKLEVYQSVTGHGGELRNDQAVNEKQVQASFESRTAVLRNLKKNFEKIHTWTNQTICELRYGPLFLDCHISYGESFYLYSPEEALAMYTEANDDSSTPAVLDMLQDAFYKTKYKNNPAQLARWEIVKNLDPLRHITREEARQMYQDGLITFEDYYLKANFSSLIMRFERENTSLLEFGDALAFDRKIQVIRDALMSYITAPRGTGGPDIKTMLDVYGIGIRSGAITAQAVDEEFFRGLIGVPEMSQDVRAAWDDDDGVRRPVTLKSKTETDANIQNLNE